MNLWAILGFGFLGFIWGTATGLLFGAKKKNKKLAGLVMCISGSIIGWSLVGMNIASVIAMIRAHTFVWHHAMPLHGLAFKVADGISTAASLTTVLIVRRVMSGKGFPMNRLVVAGMLMALGLIVIIDGLVGQLPWVVVLLIGAPAWIVALQLPSRMDRRRMARWIIRNERAQRKFIRENPDLAAYQLTRAYQPWP